MATITSSGIGSGLDIESLVTQLMTAERTVPEKLITAKETSAQTKLSAYGQITSALNAFKSSMATLNNASLFTSMKTTVSDSTVMTATASGTPKAGSYSVEVLQMAQGQRVVSNATTAPTVAAGTLTFNFGTYETTGTGDDAVTTFNGTSSQTITLPEGKTSLSDLRDAINSAGIGVTASIVNNGKIDQLVIASTAEGATSGFTMSGTDGLAGFSYDASTGGTSTLSTLDAAQDAKLKVGGIEISRTSNVIDDAIEGLTLNLLDSKPGTTLRVSVSNDREAAKTAISDMVTKYNEAMTLLQNLTSYTPAESDDEEAVSGTLVGDGTTRNLMRALRSTMSEGISGLGKILGMSLDDDGKASLGIAIGSDGMITMDTGKLDTALANSSADLSSFLTGTSGFASRMQTTLNGYLDSTTGVLTARTASLDSQIDDLADQRTKLEARMEVLEARYRAQFTAMDSTLSSLNTSSSYITQLMNSLSSSN
ncbi:flagellar filament capping protein FliD [Azoarcus sp. TTM-91]|uniref:flagellar filament capping protein FliD n=1 Tax=Azoarcus sp. TTM-91 TaxID=2691581 RepID=UPI00145F3572|nr:flagellar filament capping protein FliD [Azoarcus sp. TTM-91]NMG33199.1 flagellar filament capping protein FliD [Azoarcus sp. TTM-91]